jgi:sec-independent protein translocase protein TatA
MPMPFNVLLAGLIPTGGGEWVLILLVLLLLFGGTKLPALAKGLGQSMKEFKKAAKDDEPIAPSKDEPKKPDLPGAN